MIFRARRCSKICLVRVTRHTQLLLQSSSRRVEYKINRNLKITKGQLYLHQSLAGNWSRYSFDLRQFQRPPISSANLTWRSFWQWLASWKPKSRAVISVEKGFMFFPETCYSKCLILDFVMHGAFYWQCHRNELENWIGWIST